MTARILPPAIAMLLALCTTALHAAPALPDAGDCRRGKGIERTLGNHGYRVVVSGGYEGRGARSVKVQVWENEERDWVITEAFLRDRRTCVVRTGIRLHMMY